MKKYFRIELTTDANTTCEHIVTLAAMANGKANNLSIEELHTIAKGQILSFPTINKDTTAELISNDLLHIDRKIGDDYKTVCVIQEVMVMELAEQNGIGALAE